MFSSNLMSRELLTIQRKVRINLVAICQMSSVFKGTSKLNKAQRATETKINNKRTRTR